MEHLFFEAVVGNTVSTWSWTCARPPFSPGFPPVRPSVPPARLSRASRSPVRPLGCSAVAWCVASWWGLSGLSPPRFLPPPVFATGVAPFLTEVVPDVLLYRSTSCLQVVFSSQVCFSTFCSSLSTPWSPICLFVFMGFPLRPLKRKRR